MRRTLATAGMSAVSVPGPGQQSASDSNGGNHTNLETHSLLHIEFFAFETVLGQNLVLVSIGQSQVTGRLPYVFDFDDLDAEALHCTNETLMFGTSALQVKRLFVQLTARVQVPQEVRSGIRLW